ncbi:Thioredoxin-like 1-2, chloroplastic [Apostasia shenzhenica]|uniref:Thioredoxin-like 1-2, chloroplastic n=1 Tax=Apostasia shenzhenica TaxID=1088818 RepID=A0A2I0B207_9ASPA|nr:Thioredoxin-like 1-2, chloroplastic [Apostasia shenzhenica]
MAGILSKGNVLSLRNRRNHFFASSIQHVRSPPPINSASFGRRLVVDIERRKLSNRNLRAVPVKVALSIAKAMRWWEKGLKPNMKEISSADDLVYSLLNAGDKLVIVDLFSPGCGGCRALHPKICQFAEQNPDVLFLEVNYEQHKSMCYSLNVHVLPFFRFYRGAHGRLCSFSCTVATMKKFKDALAKHNTERCSLGPAKGLEESELLALAANRDLSFSYTKEGAPLPYLPEVKESLPTIFAKDEAEEKALVAQR